MRFIELECALLAAALCAADLAACGGSSTSGAPTTDAGAIDATSDANACGGSSALTYRGSARSPGDACGPCGDGSLVCASLEELVCLGASPAGTCVDADAQAINACGGQGSLTWASVSAAPGQVCGPCADGVLICASPTTLACTGASPGSACRDASADTGTPVDAADSGDVESGPTDSGSEAPAEAGMEAGADAEAGPTCVIPSSAYTAQGPVLPTMPQETRPATTTFVTLSLAANQLIYDPYSGLLYASVGSTQGAMGNSIAVIDPATGVVQQTVYVGSEPNVLALSDDGMAIWVGLDGANAVRRFDVSTATAGLQFSLAAMTTAQSIAVLPGTEDSIAVVQSPGFSRIVVYDDGVARPVAAYPTFLSTVTATYSPTLLYASDGYNGSNQLYTVCVDSMGAVLQKTESPGVNNNLTFAAGVVYAGNGVAFSIASDSKLGTYTAPYPGSGFITPDPATSRVFMIGIYSSPIIVTAFDQATFVPLSTDSFNVPTQFSSNTSLVRWGRYGLAFVADKTKVVIARSANVPPQP